jgi:SAM-dependent methyltransferase
MATKQSGTGWLRRLPTDGAPRHDGLAAPRGPEYTGRPVLLRKLARRFPVLKRLKRHVWSNLQARRAVQQIRPAHFHPLRGLVTEPPPSLPDRPGADIETINKSSEAYFEKSENREYWLNRPYSDPPSAPRVLTRFNLLLWALRVRAGDRVLDFGCGTGWTSVILARLGAEVVAMDIAPAALKIAGEVADRELGPARKRMRTELYSGDRIAAADEEFDFVVVNDAFHHFPNPRRLLGEFHRVLAPYGRFGFSEPGIGHAATAHSEAERALGVLEEDVDLEQLYRSGRDAGFDDLEVVMPPLEPEMLSFPMARARQFLRGVPGALPTDLLRLVLLTGPMGMFRKGAHAITSLHPREHVARIRPQSPAVTAAPGASFRLDVEVENPAETVWLRDGRRGIGYVRLGAHLHEAAGPQIELDYGRAALPQDLALGQKARVALVLTAPTAPGCYLIRLDMVNEGICWFAQQGSPVVDVDLDVRG